MMNRIIRVWCELIVLEALNQYYFQIMKRDISVMSVFCAMAHNSSRSLHQNLLDGWATSRPRRENLQSCFRNGVSEVLMLLFGTQTFDVS